MTAADIQRIKDLLPTTLGSEEIREKIAADILRRSVFSARMASARYLARIREVCAQVSEGSINQATARARLLEILSQMGHSPLDDGGLTNPASIRRLNLIVDTQRQMAASVAKLNEETQTTLEQWPAWRLTRMEGRGVPRPDWAKRWQAAGDACGWEGALPNSGIYPDWNMVALKSSPIWRDLGNGAGGFRDTLGNTFPPFAFGSGLDWEDVDAEECSVLGLTSPGDQNVETPTLSPGERDIAEAIKRLGGDFRSIAEGLV